MGKTSAKVFDLKGEEVDKVRLPQIFKTPNRPDVIKRAVVAIQSHRFQPQGRDIMAGKRTTAESRGTGLGIARIPRMKERGQRAAFARALWEADQLIPLWLKRKSKRRFPERRCV